MKLVIAMISILSLSGCATIVNDPYIPLSVSFSDGSAGECNFKNKRGAWPSKIPSTNIMIRRSDDALVYDCTTLNGNKATGSIRSEMEGGKLAASVIFWDLGITDAITDKHRTYQGNIVIPVSVSGSSQVPIETKKDEPAPTTMSNTDEKLAAIESGHSIGPKNTYSKTYPLSDWNGKWAGSRDGGTSGECGGFHNQEIKAYITNGKVYIKQFSYQQNWGGGGREASATTNLKGSINESSEIIVDHGDKVYGYHYIFSGSYRENKQRLQGTWVNDECKGEWWLRKR